MKRVTGLIVLLMWLATATTGEGVEVSISPATPTTDDEVTLCVSGWVPSPAWTLENVKFVRMGNMYLLDMYWDCEGDAVIQVVADYSHYEYLGMLNSGTHIVMVRQYFKGRHQTSCFKSFTVKSAEPDPWQWSLYWQWNIW